MVFNPPRAVATRVLINPESRYLQAERKQLGGYWFLPRCKPGPALRHLHKKTFHPDGAEGSR